MALTIRLRLQNALIFILKRHCKGVFGWPAIHTRNRGKEEPAKTDNIFIDCGCENKEQVEQLGVHVGCVITYPDEFMVLNDNKFVCRAIDNRMGGFMIAEVARLLHENGKNCLSDCTLPTRYKRK